MAPWWWPGGRASDDHREQNEVKQQKSLGSLPTQGGKIHLPQPRGQHSVGFVDVLTPGGPSEGNLIRILYPTAEQCLDNHHRWPRWAEDAYLKGLLGFMQAMLARWPSWAPRSEYYGIDRVRLFSNYIPHVGFPSVFRALNGNVFVPIVEGAAPDHSQRWPLIVFSHGLGCSRTLYSRICYDLASYGYVVLAVEHRDGSACASFYCDDDGGQHWIPHRRVSADEDEYGVRHQQVRHRSDEVSRALDLALALTDGNAPKKVKLVPENFDWASLSLAMDVDKPIVAGNESMAIGRPVNN